MTRFGLVAVATLTATLAHGQALELKGHRLNATEAELVTRYASIQCRDQETGPADRVCRVDASSAPDLGTLAGQAVNDWSFHFREGKLGLIMARLASERYEQVTEALEAKYGKPSRRGGRELQNRMGAKFENATLVWERGGELLTASRYGATIDTMLVSLASRKFILSPTPSSKVNKRAKDL